MTKFLTAITLCALAAPAVAQSPAVQQAADELASRVRTIENRVTVTEQRLDRLAEWIDRHDPDSRGAATAGGKRDYATAYNLALTTGRPLVTWNGTALCAACVTQTDGEWVNFVGDVPGCQPNTITVAVPENGELVGVGVINRWVTGDAVRGHVPSIRGVLDRWRTRRERTNAQPVPVVSASYGFAGSGGFFGPMSSNTAGGFGEPMRMMAMDGTGSGGCASCGSSGNSRVGLFGRRR